MSAADFDTIVVGSGIGGLTAAALLARVKGERVLVLEQHYKAGGFSHTFTRRGWEWDVGLHYVGAMHPGSFPRRISDFITGGRLAWAPLPEPFDHYSFPGLSFGQRSGKARYLADLNEAFPGSTEALTRYFQDLDRARVWGTLGMAGRVLPGHIAWLPRLAQQALRRYRRRTLQQALVEHIADPRLAAVLAGQCGDHGLQPSRVSLLMHAMIANHYMEGGFYPEGGPGRIATEVGQTLTEHGGEVRTLREVTEIVIEDGRVRGVRARKTGSQDPPELLRCAKVISAAGARQTWLRLVPRSVEIPFRDELEGIEAGTAMVTAYLGLNRSPTELGLEGGNRWIFDSLDFEGVAEAHGRLPEGPAVAAFLSFPSLKDPLCTGPHTAQIVAPVPQATFARWQETRFKRRGAEYEALKEAIMGRLLDLVESRHPGFRATVAYAELSSPLTVTHFARHEGGEVYGLPGLPERYGRRWLGPLTPVKGLYLAGADVLSHGMVGAMSGGLVAVTASQGLPGVVAVFRALMR